jgi:hypothetical protein
VNAFIQTLVVGILFRSLCVIRMSERMLLAFFVIPASSSSSVRLSVGSTGRTWTNEPISEEEEE